MRQTKMLNPYATTAQMSHTGPVKAYIIDTAGTIAPRESLVSAYNTSFDTMALQHYVKKGLSGAEAKAKVERGIKLRNQDSENEEYLRMQDEIAAEAFATEKVRMEIFDDVLPAFRKMKESNAKIAVYSTGIKESFRPAFRSVKLDGGKSLDDYVDVYVSSFDVGPKTDVESFRKACREVGTEAADTVYIDDEAKAAETASHAGFRKVYKRGNGGESGNFTTINALTEAVEETASQGHATKAHGHEEIAALAEKGCENEEHAEAETATVGG
jgi:methionine salvage enolase-phosphatase E1